MMNETVAKISSIITNIALLGGMTPDCWKTMLNKMLEKVADNEC